MVKKYRNLLAVLTALLLVLGMTASALAHAIDYTAYDIQPEAIFDGQSGHFRLKKPIPPGGTITFNLTLELIESAGGGTSALPVTVTFGVKNTGGGYDPAMVKFGTPSTSLTNTIVHQYVKQNNQITSLMTPVTAYAPMTPGSYHFKVQAIDGFQGKGFTPGEGIVIHFKVAGQVAQPVETVLTVNAPKILYRAPSNTITATLKEKESGTPVSSQAIDFYVEGTKYTSGTTDANGIATCTYDSSGLKVGDYTAAADFNGSGNYVASSGSATQCVTYKWIGFLPPVLVQDPNNLGLGIGLFQEKVIPVKARIADFYDQPVTDAQAQVYYAKTVANGEQVVPNIEAEPIQDDGSLMRYDAVADQYILNWNISQLNGDYNIRVGLDEGECAPGHWVPVRIGKATKTK